MSLHRADHSVQAFLFKNISGFGVEFVGIAYKFLFNRERKHVAVRERKRLTLDIADGESGSCVTFAHERVQGEPFALKNLSSFYPVAYIRQVADTEYVGCVAAQYADVMKHGRRGHEVIVDFKVSATYTFKSLVSHSDAVCYKSFPERSSGLIIFRYYREWIFSIR